jgi:hypothetical protein
MKEHFEQFLRLLRKSDVAGAFQSKDAIAAISSIRTSLTARTWWLTPLTLLPLALLDVIKEHPSGAGSVVAVPTTPEPDA